MSSADKFRQDQAAMRHPPLQPMAPSSDLGLVVPPVDPLGLPTPPASESNPIRRDTKSDRKVVGAVMIVAVIISLIAVALLVILSV